MTNPRRTILQVIPDLDAGGAERTTVEVAEAIVDAGWRAIVATAGGRLVAEVEAAGSDVVTLPVGDKMPWSILANARRLADLIRREEVDLVHARSRAAAWAAERAARAAGVPIVTTYHGTYGEKNRLKKAYNAVMARGDVVIANSEFTADLIRARYDVPDERLVVINRGVDVDRFERTAVPDERIAALRSSWGLGDADRVLLVPARLTRWKGQLVAIEAFRRAIAQGTSAQAVLILAGDAQGRDDYAGELHSAIAVAGLQDRIRLVGHCADMPAAMAIADFMIISSTEPEAFGRTSVEAQAMGTPVIATNIGGPRDTVVADGKDQTGWLVPPSDPAAMAAAIQRGLAAPDDEIAEIAAAGRRNARANYTTARLQRLTLGVYRRLLDGA
ncbi:MAG: glycosyltransferase family 4 protein [Pseudomonadota bacterium]